MTDLLQLIRFLVLQLFQQTYRSVGLSLYYNEINTFMSSVFI